MKQYFKTFLSEKGIDLETDLQVEGQINLQVGMLVDFVCSMPLEIQKKIQATLVKIDFANGNVMHYLNFLGKGMVESL